MRNTFLLALASLGLGGAANAGPCPQTDFVVEMYRHYLGREPDPCGLTNWVDHLRRGMPALQVEAEFLGCEEYYKRYGCDPRRFVQSMFHDVTGQAPCEHDINYWVGQLGRCGCRTKLALSFLQAQRNAPPRPQHQAPSNSGVPAIPYQEAYRPPVYTAPVQAPRPGYTIRLNFGR